MDDTYRAPREHTLRTRTKDVTATALRRAIALRTAVASRSQSGS